MLEKSDTDIASALRAFNEFDLDVALLVPTQTGMQKSIMDATASVRDYLQSVRFHDYASQGQGGDQKVVRRAFLVRGDGLEETSVSMYRPNTKSGDPRIWISGLGRYAEPLNLLALIVFRGDLYVVNCSAPGLLSGLRDPSTPLGEIASERKPPLDPAAIELLWMVKEISKRGWVRTMRPGDTGVGMTLETMLGIPANANKAPDYKGIEIKAKRLGARSANRVTLFSQVPDWKLSPIGSAWNLLSRYGYERAGKLRLNHEIDAKGPNSIGFFLQVDAGQDWLKQSHRAPGSVSTNHLVTWQMQTLRTRLEEKHPQTFWVGARSRGKKENEEFHYVHVEHTRQPKVRNFETLLEGGLISVDYLMSQKDPSRPTVRDHGYLFKIHPSSFEALFPPSEKYAL